MKSGLLFDKNHTSNLKITNQVGNNIQNVQNKITKNLQNNINDSVMFASNILDNRAKIAEEKFKLDIAGTVDETVQKIYQNYSSDPTNFEMESEKQLNKLLGSIPEEEDRLIVKNIYDNKKNVYYKKALNAFNNNQDRDLKYKSIDFINNSKSFLEDSYLNKFYGDYTDEDEANLQIRKNQLEYQQNLKGTNGQYLFNENEKINNYNKLYKESKINAGIKFFNEKFENIDTDLNGFLFEVDKWEKNPKTIKEDYDLSNDEYNSIMRNAKAYKKVASEYQKENKKYLSHSDLQKDLGIKIEQEMNFNNFSNEIDNLNIKKDKKTETLKIENENFDSLENLYALQTQIDHTTENNSMSLKQRNDLTKRLSKVYTQKLDERINERIKDSWFSKPKLKFEDDEKTNIDIVLDKIAELGFNPNDGEIDENFISKTQMTRLFNDVMNDLRVDGVVFDGLSNRGTEDIINTVWESNRKRFLDSRYRNTSQLEYELMLGQQILDPLEFRRKKQKEIDDERGITRLSPEISSNLEEK